MHVRQRTDVVALHAYAVIQPVRLTPTAVPVLRAPSGNCAIHRSQRKRKTAMTLGTILLIILVLILLGVFPSWPHSRGWGYGPSGVLGVLLVIVIVLLVTGRL
jgi:hypothetical protein